VKIKKGKNSWKCAAALRGLILILAALLIK